MCLVTEQIDPIILEEDRVVYKLVEDFVRPNIVWSYIRSYRYEMEKLYKTNIDTAKTPITEDWSPNPFHSPTQTNYYSERNPKDLKVISVGFHAFTTLEAAREYKHDDSIAIVKCTYPKGSEYYEDATGLCVANQIIIDKIIYSYEHQGDN